MFGIASLGQRTDPARARGTANAGPVRQAVCATWQEQCSRCGSDLRSSGSPDDAVRDNQDDRAAGRAHAPPRARAPREAANHVGQSDPRLPRRIWYRGAAGYQAGSELIAVINCNSLYLSCQSLLVFEVGAGGRGAVLTPSWDRDPPSGTGNGDHENDPGPK